MKKPPRNSQSMRGEKGQKKGGKPSCGLTNGKGRRRVTRRVMESLERDVNKAERGDLDEKGNRGS